MQNDKPAPVRKTPRIVLLEDEPALSRLFCNLIEDWFQHTHLLKFESGDEALKELSGSQPDLLILDCKHPGVSGSEILQRLIPAQPRFPILLTSQLFEPHLQLYADQGLTFKFLPKPFHIREFWKALNELVGPSDHAEIQGMVEAEAKKN
jgi:DNA-binding response OmpR family regulator